LRRVARLMDWCRPCGWPAATESSSGSWGLVVETGISTVSSPSGWWRGGVLAVEQRAHMRSFPCAGLGGDSCRIGGSGGRVAGVIGRAEGLGPGDGPALDDELDRNLLRRLLLVIAGGGGRAGAGREGSPPFPDAGAPAGSGGWSRPYSPRTRRSVAAGTFRVLAAAGRLLRRACLAARPASWRPSGLSPAGRPAPKRRAERRSSSVSPPQMPSRVGSAWAYARQG
jgi:hypothetical protein